MAFFIVVLTASFFTTALQFVTAYRVSHPQLMFALPLLVVLIWWDRRRPQDVLSTRHEVTGFRDLAPNLVPQSARRVSIASGLQQIVMTLVAHLVGASVGREAVGLQLGGWAARLRGVRGWYFGGCLAAGFAVVVAAPFAAAIFVFESKKWRLGLADGLGIALLSHIAYRASMLLGVTHAEYHPFSTTWTEVVSIGGLRSLFFIAVLILSSLALAALFLTSLARASKRSDGALNGLLLPLIFLVSVTFVFYAFGFSKVEALGLSGLGTPSMGPLFLLDRDLIRLTDHPLLIGVVKVFLTAAFVGIGVRGGEFTPLLFAGSSISVGLGALFGFPTAGLVSIGFPMIWGIAARRPIAAGVLALEVFGFRPFAALGIFMTIAVWCGIKMGDALMSSSTWRRGLYD